nr:alpha/beta hydrolase [Corynebacterium lactis]
MRKRQVRGRPGTRALALVAACALLLGGPLAACAPNKADREQQAQRAVGNPHATNAHRIEYGTESPRQYGDLFLPKAEDRKHPLPLVVFIHGGGWLQHSTALSTEKMAQDLATQGVAVWNIEYRGSDIHAKDKDGIGGWPTTYEDIAKAIDFIPELTTKAPAQIDLGRVSVAGVSAGGNLAAWACSRPEFPDGAPGANPTFTVDKCVGIAGVYDMTLAYEQHDKFVRGLLGGSPKEVPQHYFMASPGLNIAPRAQMTILHGKNDRTVNIDEATFYARAAEAAGQQVRLIALDDATHGSWGKIDGPQWKRARSAILEQLSVKR